MIRKESITGGGDGGGGRGGVWWWACGGVEDKKMHVGLDKAAI